MRKLASIQVIAEIRGIEGADAIEAVRVNGWWSVAKKGEFQVGQNCVFFEIDAVLPLEPRYEFLRKSSYIKRDWVEGFRLKTCRLRGQLSQGLVLAAPEDLKYFRPGDDVTAVLGVKLWDPPVPTHIAGQVKGNFPTRIKKTDQERIQNLTQEDIEAHRDDVFECTLKIDGSSCTVYYDIDHDYLGVCSRNLELKINEENRDNSLVKIAMEVHENLKLYCHRFGRSIALQGELAGPGIQGNKLKLDRLKFWLFDIWDINQQCYLSAMDRQGIARNLDISHVPVIGYAPVLRQFITMEQILVISEQISIPAFSSFKHSDFEGLVYKSTRDPGFSFKVINNNYLLNEK